MAIKNAPAISVLGKLTFAPTDPPRPLGTYVVQRVKPGLGNIVSDPTRTLQIRAHAPRIDKNSAAQQSRRTRVAGAVLAWHALDPAARAYWKERAKARRITGFNAYVSAWLTAEIGPGISYQPAHGTRRQRSAADVVSHQRGALLPHPVTSVRGTATTISGQRGAHRGHRAGLRAIFVAAVVVLPVGRATHGTRRLIVVAPLTAANRGALSVRSHIKHPTLGVRPGPARGALSVRSRIKWEALSVRPGPARGNLAGRGIKRGRLFGVPPGPNRGALAAHGARGRLRKV